MCMCSHFARELKITGSGACLERAGGCLMVKETYEEKIKSKGDWFSNKDLNKVTNYIQESGQASKNNNL